MSNAQLVCKRCLITDWGFFPYSLFFCHSNVYSPHPLTNFHGLRYRSDHVPNFWVCFPLPSRFFSLFCVPSSDRPRRRLLSIASLFSCAPFFWVSNILLAGTGRIEVRQKRWKCGTVVVILGGRFGYDAFLFSVPFCRWLTSVEPQRPYSADTFRILPLSSGVPSIRLRSLASFSSSAFLVSPGIGNEDHTQSSSICFLYSHSVVLIRTESHRASLDGRSSPWFQWPVFRLYFS